LIYYAGWCDKYTQMHSSVNPVSGSYFNFSVPEPMGVIGVFAPEDSGLLGLVTQICSIIAGGNTCVVLASEHLPLCAISFSEVIATSDVPNGVVNILTGKIAELNAVFASHMNVNALLYCGSDATVIKTIQDLQLITSNVLLFVRIAIMLMKNTRIYITSMIFKKPKLLGIQLNKLVVLEVGIRIRKIHIIKPVNYFTGFFCGHLFYLIIINQSKNIFK
jgi:hypothetical protein